MGFNNINTSCIADGVCPPGMVVTPCSTDIPDCIATSMICDGETQCTRGEDEFFCETTGKEMHVWQSQVENEH